MTSQTEIFPSGEQ